MKNKLTDKLKPILSPERLKGYENRIRNKLGLCTTIDCYAYYNWNTALSESFYSSLQALEISLRNTIHNNASQYFQNPKWFEDPKILSEKSLKNINLAQLKLKKKRKNLSSGRILAELSFGFWTSLFNKRYDQVLWHKIIKTAFPNMNSAIHTRATLSERLNKIRILGNRIFHYEPI